MIRCSPVGDFAGGAPVEVSCGEIIDSGTWVETAIGGEFPGPICFSPAQERVNSFAQELSCDGSGAPTFCGFGEILET
ncbi:MAG: hypothetical protein ACI81R_001372 [Bradymonadia bacterium]|jgi:hypothetical protein